MSIVGSIKRAMPPMLKRRLRRLIAGGGHPDAPAVRHIGCVLDLYYWTVGDGIDTVVPIENYFSVYFPDLDTSTEATIEVYSPSGEMLGSMVHPVGHMATPTLRLSTVVERLGIKTEHRYGNVLWHTRVPKEVLRLLAGEPEPILFWDRSYIGYVGANEQVTFVHGVDKTFVVADDGRRLPWRMSGRESFTATPEIPLLLSETDRTDIIVQNRFRGSRRIDLTARDRHGRTKSWTSDIAPLGVHLFALDTAGIDGLDLSAPLRLEVAGLPTRYGRPIVFKRFSSGAVSAMHC